MARPKTAINTNCSWCGISIEVPKSKFKDTGNCCSKSCAVKHYRAKNPRNIDVICECCGRVFNQYTSRIERGQGRFCSRECSAKVLARENELWRHLHTPKARANYDKYCEKIRNGEVKRTAWNKGEDVEKQCQRCKKTFTTSYKNRDVYKYCSKECGLLAKKERTGEEHPLYNQVKQSCLICGTEFTTKPSLIKMGWGKLCSINCVGAYTTKLQGGKRSSIELKIEEQLIKLGIPFESQYKLGRWICDFGIPKHKLIVECDGMYWHNLPKQRAKDERKNNDIAKKGWTIIRLWEDEINNDINGCVDKILTVINT